MPGEDASPLTAFSDALSTRVAAASSRIVAVRSHRARSSGFVWGPGLVVTADEALAEDGDIGVVLPGGEAVAAKLAGRDPSTDVALLRVDGVEAPPLATAAVPSVGALALALGAAEGGPVAAVGVVAAVGPAWRSLRGGEIEARIELDLALSSRAEGGLVFDAAGQALGMAVYGPRRRALVIPTATVDRVAARLQSHGRVARGYLGLGLQPVQLDGGGGLGAMVMSVEANGPGEAAGVRQGDVIVAWEGEPIHSFRALLRKLGPDSAGRTVVLALRRGGEPLEVRLTIGERPET